MSVTAYFQKSLEPSILGVETRGLAQNERIEISLVLRIMASCWGWWIRWGIYSVWGVIESNHLKPR